MWALHTKPCHDVSRDRHHAGIGDRRKIRVPDSVTELGRDASRDLNSETSLAGAAGTGQRHQPVSGQQLPHILHLGFAPNKTRELHRKVMRTNALSGTQWRELVTQVGVTQLHHSFRAGQIAQPVNPQIGQPGIRREPIDDDIARDARQQP